MNEISTQDRAVIDRGGSQSDLRRYNERVVLSALERHPGLFNAELARRTGLAAQTISVILRVLDGQGLIARGSVLRGRRGQPAIPLFLKPDGAYGIGAALCWRRLTICMGDFSGTVLAEDNIRHGFPDFDGMIEKIAGSVERFAGRLTGDGQSRISGLGLALPGAMDRYLMALDAPGDVVRAWTARDFCAELSAAISMPVWPVSYGAAASGAEARAAGTGAKADFAYFFLGSLLMGGIVSGSGGFVTSGASGTMLGAMVVPGPDGASLRADSIVSAHGLQLALKVGGISDPGAIGVDWDWRRFPGPVDTWLDEAGRALAHVIVNTQCAFDLANVVVDGFLLPDLIAALIARLEPAFEKLPVAMDRLPVVRQGRLGPRAAMLGAARLPLYQRFFNTDPGS